jgi:hypothetical protein
LEEIIKNKADETTVPTLNASNSQEGMQNSGEKANILHFNNSANQPMKKVMKLSFPDPDNVFSIVLKYMYEGKFPLYFFC